MAKIFLKIYSYLREVANTNSQTDRQTYECQLEHYLLGGGNYTF